MPTFRKIAKFTFLEDEFGRIIVRDENRVAVTVGRLQSWVDRFAQNPSPRFTASEIEQKLLAQHNERFGFSQAGGYVYIIQRANSHVKIGQTRRLKDRIKSLRQTSESQIELIHVIKCVDRRAIERWLHHLFKDKHLHGEWFALTDEDIALIKTRTEA